MAQRVTTRKVLSDEVQGEGSYVMLRALPYGMVTRRSRIDPDNMDELMAFNREFLAEIVVDWNWVDDAGKSLSLPADPEQLVMPEFEFIARAAGLYDGAKKA